MIFIEFVNCSSGITILEKEFLTEKELLPVIVPRVDETVSIGYQQYNVLSVAHQFFEGDDEQRITVYLKVN